MHHLLNDVVFLQGGKVTCSPPVCPKPDCSGKSGDVVTLKGQCCPICKGEFSLKIQVSHHKNSTLVHSSSQSASYHGLSQKL